VGAEMSVHTVLGTGVYAGDDSVLSVGEYMGVDLAVRYATSEASCQYATLIKDLASEWKCSGIRCCDFDLEECRYLIILSNAQFVNNVGGVLCCVNNVFVICMAGSSVQFVYGFVHSKVWKIFVMILRHFEGYANSKKLYNRLKSLLDF